MKTIKIQCPAKVNLNLKVINKREDGFHNIESIMQAIDLYDYLTITISESEDLEIILSGNSTEIPYNEKNLVYKAARLFFEKTNINKGKVEVYIDKNIPVSAGLAGGSTNAAGMLFGLNKLYGELCTLEELHELCAKLGSDLNFCLHGGCMMTTGRGEILKDSEYKESKISLIKPLNLGISAKEAYTKFSQKLEQGVDLQTRQLYVNDLEWAVINDYEELKYIKSHYPTAIMTGSGSTYFSLNEDFVVESGFLVINDLHTIPDGVKVIS